MCFLPLHDEAVVSQERRMQALGSQGIVGGIQPPHNRRSSEVLRALQGNQVIMSVREVSVVQERTPQRYMSPSNKDCVVVGREGSTGKVPCKTTLNIDTLDGARCSWIRHPLAQYIPWIPRIELHKCSLVF